MYIKQARPISQNWSAHKCYKRKSSLQTCPEYKEFRFKYIKKYYWEKLSVQNYKELCNLGKYLQLALITAMAFHNFFSDVLLCLYYIADTVPYIM